MAASPVTFSCIVYPKNKKDKPFPAVLVGYAWATGLEPEHPIEMPPPDTGEPPTDAHPEHPIYIPPAPIDPPPTDPDAHPEHPIVLPPDEIPPEPPILPDNPGMVKPPPPEGGWGWSPVYGWGWFPGTGGAGPKRK